MNLRSNINRVLVEEYKLDFEKDRIYIDITLPISLIYRIIDTGKVNILEVSKIIVEIMIINFKYNDYLGIDSIIGLLEYELDLNNGYGQTVDMNNIYTIMMEKSEEFSFIYEYIYSSIEKFIKPGHTVVPIQWVGDNYFNNMSLEVVLTKQDIDVNRPGLIY